VGSAVDHPLHGLRVAVALDRHAGRCLVELRQVLWGEVEVRRCEVLVEALETPGAGDRSDPRLLREQPGQGDPPDGGLLAVGDRLDEVDEGEIGLQRLALEARSEARMSPSPNSIAAVT
jgi:hypothetical protein